MLYPQASLDFIWAEAKAAEIAHHDQIASHLRAAALLMESHNYIELAPPHVKASWRERAPAQKRLPSTNLEDLI